jgi:glycosyltransferase involved in cell wall biosynthesis
MLSAVLIVKNEEELLSKCLDTLKGVDEIIITDTGSTDKTKEIASKYTDKIYDFPWIDSFCKARNFSNSKATGEWILTIDADEELLTPMNTIKDILSKTDKELLNVIITDGKGNEHKFPRLFKNSKDIFWRGDIHESLSKTGQEDTPITIKYGYSPAHKNDPDRTLRILKKSLKTDPKLTRERYYLAREYFYREQWEKAIKELDIYLKLAKWLPEKNDAWLLRAKCLAGLEKWEEACDSAWQALKYNANFKEVLEFIGNHMDTVNKERWLSYAKIADNRDVLFVRTNKG